MKLMLGFYLTIILTLLLFNVQVKLIYSVGVCRSNEVFSGFEVKSPKNGEVVTSKTMNIEIQFQIYNLENFTPIRADMLLCVTDSISGKNTFPFYFRVYFSNILHIGCLNYSVEIYDCDFI